MRDRIAGKRAHDGLGVLDLAVEHRIDQLCLRHQIHIHKLIVVGIRAAEGETRCHIDMDDLVAKTGSRGDGGEVLDAAGGEPGLLEQLALGAIERILARIELPAGISTVTRSIAVRY